MENFSPHTLEDRYPNNSMKAKQQPKEEPKQEEAKSEEPKKVVKKAAKKKKKNFLSKMGNEIIEDDAPSVGSYLIHDIFIPALKDLIYDVICGGSEKMLYGVDRARQGRKSSKKNGSYVPYNSIYGGARESKPEKKRKGAFNSTDYILETKQEAEDVLDRMIDYIQRFDGVVSVAEFLEFVDVTPDDFTASNWGWTDLRGASTQRVRGGYVVKLPRPEPIND